MSLYNALFGENSESHVLLGMIGVNKEYFDRYRDVELIEDGKKIRVFTRLGGGNREDYQETWDKIQSHKLYITDYDDDFDCTYAYIEYNFHIYLSCHEESACCDIDVANKASFMAALAVLLKEGKEKYDLTNNDIDEIVLTTKITSDISKDIKIEKQTIEVHSLDELKNILNKIEKGEKI